MGEQDANIWPLCEGRAAHCHPLQMRNAAQPAPVRSDDDRNTSSQSPYGLSHPGFRRSPSSLDDKCQPHWDSADSLCLLRLSLSMVTLWVTGASSSPWPSPCPGLPITHLPSQPVLGRNPPTGGMSGFQAKRGHRGVPILYQGPHCAGRPGSHGNVTSPISYSIT